MTVPVNPTTVTLTLSKNAVGGVPLPSGEVITGATLYFAPATLNGAGDPAQPSDSAFVIKAAVTQADFAKADPVTGQFSFPLSDLTVNLANGLWAARATETATLNGQAVESAMSPGFAFFTVAPVVPAAPDAPAIAVA